jgi:hypothetical protein
MNIIDGKDAYLALYAGARVGPERNPLTDV